MGRTTGMRLRMFSPTSTSLRPMKLAVRKPNSVSVTKARMSPVPGIVIGREGSGRGAAGMKGRTRSLTPLIEHQGKVVVILGGGKRNKPGREKGRQPAEERGGGGP